MPHARPTDDPRRQYPRFLQIGLAASLVTLTLAFTVPFGPGTPEAFVAAGPDEPFVLDYVPPTAIDPPPPPAAPPPPAEVPDDADVADVVESLDLDLRDELPPLGPPPADETVQPASPPVLPAPVDPPDPPQPIADPPVEDGVFIVVEEPPVLIGGLDALQRRVEYPRLAREAGIEGRVFVQFVVDERGDVVDPVVTRSPSDLLSRAALDAVREVRFEPGVQRGRPVKVRFALPVHFVLN